MGSSDGSLRVLHRKGDGHMFMPALEKVEEQDTTLMIPAGCLRKPEEYQGGICMIKKRSLFISIVTSCRRFLGNQEFHNTLLSSEEKPLHRTES